RITRLCITHSEGAFPCSKTLSVSNSYLTSPIAQPCYRSSITGTRLLDRSHRDLLLRSRRDCTARGKSMLSRIARIFFEALIVLAMIDNAWSQGSMAPERIVVSYPSKSITSFPILETAQRRGFFRKENLDVNVVYMRGGIDIKAIITGDADFGTGSTTAVTAFVAGAPLRVVMSLNSYVDQALYPQT